MGGLRALVHCFLAGAGWMALGPLACSLDGEGIPGADVASSGSGNGGAPATSSGAPVGSGGPTVGSGGGAVGSTASSSAASSTASSTASSSASAASSGTGGSASCDDQPSCMACVICAGDTDCIAEGDTCDANGNCIPYGTCLFACCNPMCNPMCVGGCNKTYPGGQPDFKALRCCAAKHCPTACAPIIDQGCP